MNRPADPPCPICGAPCPTADLFCWMCRGRVRDTPAPPAEPPAPGPAPTKNPKTHPLGNAPKASCRAAEDDIRYMRRVVPPVLIVMAAGNALMRSAQGTLCMIVLLAAYLLNVAITKNRPGSPAGKFEAVLAALTMIGVVATAFVMAIAITCTGLYGYGGKN